MVFVICLGKDILGNFISFWCFELLFFIFSCYFCMIKNLDVLFFWDLKGF